VTMDGDDETRIKKRKQGGTNSGSSPSIVTHHFLEFAPNWKRRLRDMDTQLAFALRRWSLLKGFHT
jgi:hypothetical protein